MSTQELEKRGDLTPEAQEVLDAQQEEFADSGFQTPILKVCQPLTREVGRDEAEAGEFLNTLTSESLGTNLEFIIAYFQRGRFAANRDTNKAYVAFGSEIPEAWGELVGEEFVGSLFSEYPDAEEVYKVRVNSKEIPWGSGPLVSTTYNYTGLAVVQPIEGSEDAPELQPVRLSLKRTDVPTARKINSLVRMSLRNKPTWDRVFDLETFKKDFTKGPAYLVNAKLGRDTTSEEKELASELAIAAAAGRVQERGEHAEAAPAVEPDAKGGADL